jgi:hypothetical protein
MAGGERTRHCGVSGALPGSGLTPTDHLTLSKRDLWLSCVTELRFEVYSPTMLAGLEAC